MKKIIFLIVGILMLLIGLIGVVIPILPTTPFLLISSVCFLNSSEKLDRWFKGTELYKSKVEPFIENRGLTLKAKLSILIPVSLILITVIILLDNIYLRILIGVLLAVKIFVFIKIKTHKNL